MKYRSNADLGGKPGYGRVVPEPEGELFHAEWEPQALALTLAAGATGTWNIDMSRSTREVIADYASMSYYQLWVEGLERLLALNGLATADEFAAARMLHAPRPVKHVLQAADVPAALARGAPTERPTTAQARFAAGDRVRTRAAEVPHHTRLPAYARGKVGKVEAARGMHVFADTNAQGLGEQPQWLYTVVFEGRELWGEQAAPGLTVSIDAWEPYLEPCAPASPPPAR